MELETKRGAVRDISPEKLYDAIPNATSMPPSDNVRPLRGSATKVKPSDMHVGWTAQILNHAWCQG